LVVSLLFDGIPVPIVGRTPSVYLSDLLLLFILTRFALGLLFNRGRATLSARQVWQINGFGVLAACGMMYLATALMAIVASPDILRSIASLRVVVQSILLAGVVYFDLHDNVPAIRKVLLSSVLVGIVVALVLIFNVYQTFPGNWTTIFRWNKGYLVKGQIHALGWYSNAAAGVLVILIGIAIGLSRTYRMPQKFMIWGAIAVMLSAVFITSSTGAMGSLLLGVLVLFLVRRPLGMVALAVFGLVLMIVLPVAPMLDSASSVIDRVLHSLDSRTTVVWSTGLQDFVEQPVFGIGRGIAQDLYTTSLHNSILTAFVESGTLAGIFFVGMLLLIVLRLVTLGTARRENGTIQGVTLALQLGIIVGIINSFGEILLESPRYAILFWLCVGLSYALPARKAVVLTRERGPLVYGNQLPG
jgi:O-antigen ligase